ncbi:Sugar transporter ERD6-like 8 [Vitis vinifera]|uniref:Sugar transporter ERD6-like 8 n=1 Tax=Vitis vinifera TaxID=29760 RepID=A0A438KC24_VITVI|nr:Sugar transporter ERD6-like 8 [Vitis vinifera]
MGNCRDLKRSGILGILADESDRSSKLFGSPSRRGGVGRGGFGTPRIGNGHGHGRDRAVTDRLRILRLCCHIGIQEDLLEQDPLPASTAQLDPPKILPDITDQTGGESDFLTPHKKLLHSINAVEKAMRKNWGNCREFQCKEGPERKKGYVNGSIDGVLFGIQGNEDGNNRTDKDQKKVELTTSLTGVLLQYKYSFSETASHMLKRPGKALGWWEEKMAAKQEVEKGNANITEPLIVQEKQGEAQIKSNNGGLRMVLLSIFVAVCGSFEFGSCAGYSAPAQYGIMNELGLSYSQYSVFGSILSIGAMIGAISSGWIADSIGSKRGHENVIHGLYCRMDHGLTYLLFLLGYGIGILSYVIPVFIAEITPKNHRGTLATANQARAGYEREFKAELQKLRGVEADISEEEAEIQEYMVTHQLLPKVGIMVGVGLMVFQQFGGYNGIVFYADQIFVSAGILSAVSLSLVSILLHVNFLPQVIVTAFGASLIDRLGRRPLLMVALKLTLNNVLYLHQVPPTTNALKLLSRPINWHPIWVPILAVTGIMVHIGFYSVGLGPIPWLIMSEIFPLHVKAIAGSLVTLVNWFGAWAVSYTFNFLMNWSSHAAIVFIIMVVPETKGQTLEEIQASMNRFTKAQTDQKKRWEKNHQSPVHNQKQFKKLGTNGMMGRDSSNGGLITASLLHGEVRDEDGPISINDLEGGDAPPAGGGSSSFFTIAVVFSTLIAVCGSFIFGTAVGYSSPAESGIVNDLGLSTAEYSIFGSILTIGGMIGAVMSGKIADLIGRERCNVGFRILLHNWVDCNSILRGFLASLSFFSPRGAWLLDIGRLLIGCGIGALSYVVPVYIAEITPKNLRGRFSGLNMLFISCGTSVMYFTGGVVTWRILALIGLELFHVYYHFLVYSLFRSLLGGWPKVGREKEFEASLQHLRGKDTDISFEASDIKDYTRYLEGLSETRIIDIFQRKYAYCLTVGVGLMIVQEFGGLNGFAFYTSSILDSAGFLSKVGTMAYGLVQIPATILGFCSWNMLGLLPYRIGIPLAGPSLLEGGNSHFGTCWRIGKGF